MQMNVVDDPTERVDKVMDEILKTKNKFSTLSPTTLTTLHPQRLFYATITNKYFLKIKNLKASGKYLKWCFIYVNNSSLW
jgi:hypothetical protein